MSDTPTDPQPVTYAIRIGTQAIEDIDQAQERLAGLAGDEVADAWRAGLQEQVHGLAQNPRRHPLIAEARHFAPAEVRQVLYRRTSSSVAYRLLFTVEDSGPDGPMVLLFHVRHAAAKPISRNEARELGGENERG